MLNPTPGPNARMIRYAEGYKQMFVTTYKRKSEKTGEWIPHIATYRNKNPGWVLEGAFEFPKGKNELPLPQVIP